MAEVLSEEKCRLSLSGWFHGPSLPRPSRYIEPPVPRHTHIPRDVSQVSFRELFWPKLSLPLLSLKHSVFVFVIGEFAV